MKKIITCIILIMIVTITSSCNKQEQFKFEANLQDITEVTMGEPFVIKVTTTNVSGKDYEYLGSSTIVGAIIYLSSKIDGKEIIFRPRDIPVTKDLRHITIKNGEKIKREWTFESFDGIKEGTYDLNFEFEGKTYKIEDFVVIK